MQKSFISLMAAIFLPMAAQAQMPVYTISRTTSSGSVEIRDAWMPKAPSKDVAAVYLTFINHSTQPVTITGVISPETRQAEIHSNAVGEDGKLQMRPAQAITVPPGAVHAFAEDGDHIMLFNLPHRMDIGDTVPLNLLVDGIQPVPFKAAVRLPGGTRADTRIESHATSHPEPRGKKEANVKTPPKENRP